MSNKREVMLRALFYKRGIYYFRTPDEADLSIEVVGDPAKLQAFYKNTSNALLAKNLTAKVMAELNQEGKLLISGLVLQERTGMYNIQFPVLEFCSSTNDQFKLLKSTLQAEPTK